MAFIDDLKLTFSEARLIQWTNPGGNTNATTIDTTVIDHVERLVNGAFQTLAGAERLDLTNDKHLQPAMRYAGVLLRVFAGDLGQFSKDEQRALDDISAVRKVEHSDTIVPDSKSTNQVPVGEDKYSFFDSYTMYRNRFPVRRRNVPVDFGYHDYT